MQCFDLSQYSHCYKVHGSLSTECIIWQPGHMILIKAQLFIYCVHVLAWPHDAVASTNELQTIIVMITNVVSNSNQCEQVTQASTDRKLCTINPILQNL